MICKATFFLVAIFYFQYIRSKTSILIEPSLIYVPVPLLVFVNFLKTTHINFDKSHAKNNLLNLEVLPFPVSYMNMLLYAWNLINTLINNIDIYTRDDKEGKDNIKQSNNRIKIFII